eukprot:TRINITY_DN25411_c1_g1_i1.p1 TRINITY_DN25411_c1_g1~~TRINITY_DN25411_c1_g1_i1.p1  ORF type:complete len:263 (+),score=43.13 TRINITY_DN25411_c1_g1_i1:88-876(+)
MAAPRYLQLYIFEKAPRGIPPITDLRGLRGESLVRAVRRAALHPWKDARFWRQAASHVSSASPDKLSGRDLAQVCMAFSRIEFPSPILSRYIQKYVEERRQALNTFELAAVLMYFSSASAGSVGSEDFVRLLADEAVNEWRQRETIPWSAWRMLVTGAAQAGVNHKQLFTVAAPHLAKNAKFMNGRDAVDVCSAFAEFRFRHNALLSELARFLPSMGLADREVMALQAAFDRLEFDAPLLLRLRELRGLGDPHSIEQRTARQ